MTTFFINIFSFGTILSSIFSITSKNPVISVIFLISTFVQASLYLILIGINFVGISYIIIYVGAIAVLFLFVIMMINIKLTDILETGIQYTKNLPLAIAIGSLFIFIFYNLIPFNFNNIPALTIILDKINFFYLIEFTNYQIINNFNIFSYIINNNLSLSEADSIISNFLQIEVLGHALYTYDAILLILLSIIFLLAMFATIVISKQK